MPQTDAELIDAHAATALLGVKSQTLYAYVSRGLIRSINPGKRKASLYYRADVEALQLRGRTRRAENNFAERVIRGDGGAVLQTSITALTERGPAYRGNLATDLAGGGRTFEQCAELIWSGLLPTHQPVWEPPAPIPAYEALMGSLRTRAPSMNAQRVMGCGVEMWASFLGDEAETRAAAPIIAARNLIHVLAGCAGLLRGAPTYRAPQKGEQIAVALGQSLGMPMQDEYLALLDVALVLCADHELAPATFAARVAASAGSDIFSCVSAALGAFGGPLTGLGCDLSETLLRQAATPTDYVATVSRIAERKQPLPGYNHPSYPAGDPRALMLQERLSALKVKTPEAVKALRCIESACRQLHSTPGLTALLATLSVALGLPQGSGTIICATGRAAGWIAHVYEQRTAGFLMHPRAQYVGH